MANRIKYVALKVDTRFFDKLFEPARRKYERKIKRPISQTKFTSHIVDRFIMRKRKTFVPKEFKEFNFYA